MGQPVRGTARVATVTFVPVNFFQVLLQTADDRELFVIALVAVKWDLKVDFVHVLFQHEFAAERLVALPVRVAQDRWSWVKNTESFFGHFIFV